MRWLVSRVAYLPVLARVVDTVALEQSIAGWQAVEGFYRRLVQGDASLSDLRSQVPASASTGKLCVLLRPQACVFHPVEVHHWRVLSDLTTT